MPPYAFFKKQFVPLSEAKIGIRTYGFNYGTAAFEGIRGNWNEEDQQLYLFRSKEHYERLKKSCSILSIELPYSVEELCQIELKLVEMCGYKEDIYIRPLAYKSEEKLGVGALDLEDDYCIFVQPFGPYFGGDSGIRCRTSSWRRVADTMIPPRAKVAGIYVNSHLAHMEAVKSGYDEAIMLTQDGFVSEGSGENIFLVQNGKLVTPPTSDNILPGITRATVMEVAKAELGIETAERRVDRSELYTSDECFVSGTAVHVTPVVEVDDHKVGDGKIGPVTKQLRNMYFDIVRGRDEKYVKWCTPVFTKTPKT
ncbi:MAG: branched-chain amino acid transaminase [Dehalococcoidia bacterium]